MNGALDGSSGGFRDALDTGLSDREGTVAVFTAARRVVRRAVARRRTRDCRVARGRTVWPVPGCGLAVVESPNRYGRRETLPDTIRTSIPVTESGARHPASWRPSALVVGSGGRWQPFSPESSATAVPWHASDDHRRYEARTRVARDPAGRLAQVGRVDLAHGILESPASVFLAPFPPQAVSKAVRGVTGAISTVPMVIAVLPGSLRTTVEDDPGRPSTKGCVEQFSTAVMEEPWSAAG